MQCATIYPAPSSVLVTKGTRAMVSDVQVCSNGLNMFNNGDDEDGSDGEFDDHDESTIIKIRTTMQ